MINQSVATLNDPSTTGLYIILYQGNSGIGVVASYDSPDHIGTHESYEHALNHAKRLAITHPGNNYIIAKVEDIISQSKDQNKRLLSSVQAKIFGDYYTAVRAKDVRAKRLNP